MNFEHRCTLPVARGMLWQFLMDVPQMATCVPGVEGVTASGDDQYAGRLRVKVGPIHLTLQGVVTIQERDQQQWRAAARGGGDGGAVGGGGPGPRCLIPRGSGAAGAGGAVHAPAP